MFIPFGTDRGLRHPTRVTPAIIALNIAAYGWQMLGGAGGGDPGTFGSLVLVPGESPWWTYITYAFLHDTGAIWHILFNMVFLWVFGPVVEDRLGRVGFAAFYLGAGAVAGFAHAAASGSPVIGASGAVSGVTGAALALFPRARVRTLIIFFLIGVYMVPMWFFIGFAVARDLLPVLLGRASRVAYEAHLGGYAFGLSVCLGLLWLRVIPREPYDLINLARQAKRRRQIRDAVRGSDRSRDDRLRARRDAKDEARLDRLAADRAEVTRAINDDRLDDAATLYRRLLDGYGDDGSATTLPRRAQYALAGHAYRSGDMALAAEAFGRYVRMFPNDPEAAEIRLLAGRALVATGRVDDAREMLRRAAERLTDPALAEAARTELAALGATEDEV